MAFKSPKPAPIKLEAPRVGEYCRLPGDHPVSLILDNAGMGPDLRLDGGPAQKSCRFWEA